MASRWAYEALAVSQFKHNDYEKHFFGAEMEMSQNSFQRSFRIPEMENVMKSILSDSTNYQSYEDDFELLVNEHHFLVSRFDVRPFPLIRSLEPNLFNQSTGFRFLSYLDNLQEHFQVQYKNAVQKKDSIYSGLVNEIGKEAFYELKKNYFNESISDLVTNRNDFKKILRAENKMVQRKDPIFKEPYSLIGRAHFYAPYKNIGPFKIGTVTYNVMMLWLITIILYALLLNDALRKLITFISSGKKWK